MTHQKELEVLLIDLAKHFEGLHILKGSIVYPYHDPVGYPTIGYGQLLSKIPFEDLSKYHTKSILECEDMLLVELRKAIGYALKLSPILAMDYNVYRLVAIADFCFNCGQGNYTISTLRKCINSEDYTRASEEILKWDKAAGKKLKGLTIRRKAEHDLIKKIKE